MRKKHKRDDFYWWLLPLYVLICAWRASALATVIILLALIWVVCAAFSGCRYEDNAGYEAGQLALKYGDHEDAADIEADQ